MFVVSSLTFAAISFLPGDAAGLILGQHATPERLEELRHELGLDKPPAVRYIEWVQGAIRGDLGRSQVASREPVAPLVATRLRNTLILAGVSAVLIAIIGFSLGAYSGARSGSIPDQILSASTLI